MWIKICGITEPALAARIAALGPDALGLNFYSPSPRSVSVATAREIAAALPAEVEPIGVFVNHPVEEVLEIVHAVGLRTVQLHGDEPPETARRLQAAGLEIIRAFRVGEAGLDSVAAELQEFTAIGVELRACLVDARIAGAYGGTGHTAPWNLLTAEWKCEWPPLILAGGLKPDNLRQAIDLVGPWGIDTASGVEVTPGRQDLAAVQQFIQCGRQRI